MITEIEVMTVAELHAQLQKLIEDGVGDVPFVQLISVLVIHYRPIQY